MAHDIVFGICDDKCQVEVYAKSQLYKSIVCTNTAVIGITHIDDSVSITSIKNALDRTAYGSLSAVIYTENNATNFPTTGDQATLMINGLTAIYITIDAHMYIKSLKYAQGGYAETAWRQII